MTAPHPLDNPALLPLLSRPRLTTYLASTGGNTADALRLYAWNIEASAAMWGGFSVLEVCLRNAENQQLENLGGRSDWWNSPSIALHVEQRDALRSAGGTASGVSAQHGQVVSNLTFGFWTSLLSNRYHQRLWVPALSLAFPHYSGRRGGLQQRLEELRRLRNRLAHHEPIFNRNLAADHQDILTVLAAIEPAASAWVDQDSRLPEVLATRAITIAGKRPTSF